MLYVGVEGIKVSQACGRASRAGARPFKPSPCKASDKTLPGPPNDPFIEPLWS